MAGETALELRGVTKKFPGVLALDNVDLVVYPGEIHALVGENGAGKSTLIKIISGVYSADEGAITVGGHECRIDSPKDARAKGIVVVPQDILMSPELSIGRNILLGMEHWQASAQALTAEERAKVHGALERLGVELDLGMKARALNVPELRLAQIARAMLQPGHVMVLDEPTAVLSESDSDCLLDRLETFRKDGKAILYVTHRLSEVMRLADRITILRDGMRVGLFKRGEISRDEIGALMAKDSVHRNGQDDHLSMSALRPTEPGRQVLAVRNVSAAPRLHGISLNVREHEIIGIAGLQGSGHGQLLRAIAGVEAPSSGHIEVDGVEIALGSPRAAHRRGVLLVPADRRDSAIIPRQSIRVNIILSCRVRSACRKLGLRWPGRERRLAKSYEDLLKVRPPTTETPIGTLSGGNQQKVVLARALESNTRVLLIEEPTQGIDVRTKAQIHNLLRKVAVERKCCVVVPSSEFEELIELAQTIYVMRLGRIVKTLSGVGITYRQILENALL
jgi:ABC-type sugar transport system ATPase subunit